MAKKIASLAFLALFAMAGCAAEEQPRYVYAQPHCYKTLGTVDCHAEPLPKEATRKVGHYQAPIN